MEQGISRQKHSCYFEEASCPVPAFSSRQLGLSLEDSIANKTINETGIISFIGILWNGDKRFSLDMLQDLMKISSINSVELYDIGEQYRGFVEDCYEFEKDNTEIAEYLVTKTERLISYENSSIISFAVQINNPVYDYDMETERFKCRQISMIKKQIREKYKSYIEDYFFDVLIHISDIHEETEHISKVLKKYSSCLKPFFEFSKEEQRKRTMQEKSCKQNRRSGLC